MTSPPPMAKQCIPARSRQASKRPAEVNGPSSTLGSFSALARAMNEPAAVLRQRRDMGSRAPSGAPSWRDKVCGLSSARSVHEELDRTTHIPNDHKMSHQPRRLAWRRLLPTFASVAELRSQPEWLSYVTRVYSLSSLTFPLDTRPFSLFYVNHLPQALRTTLVSDARSTDCSAVPVLSHSRTNGVMWHPKRHCNASEPTAAGRPLRRQGDAFAMWGGNGGPGKGAALAWAYSHAATGHREATAAAVELPAAPERGVADHTKVEVYHCADAMARELWMYLAPGSGNFFDVVDRTNIKPYL